MKLQSATEKAFAAAFFFLPLSKPLLFLSLLAAFLLFAASGGMIKALRAWRTLPWVAPALILSLLPLLSLLVHRQPEQRFANLELSYYWLIAFMTFLAASQMRILPWMRALSLGIFLVFCYAQLAAKDWPPFGHAPSALANYILYSQFLAVGIVLLSVLYKHEERRGVKILYLAGMGLMLTGLVTGLGRTGMVIIAVLLPFISSNLFRSHSRARLALACFAASLAMLMSPNVQNRIDAGVQDIQLFRKDVTQTSLGYRFEMWGAAWSVFRTHPVFGAGPAGFGAAWSSEPREKAAKAFVEPHNAYLFFASGYGLIGLASLIWLYAALLWTGWVHRQSLAGGIVVAFAVVCIVASLTNTLFMGAVSHAWLMLFIGLQGGLMRVSPNVAMAYQKKAAQA